MRHRRRTTAVALLMLSAILMSGVGPGTFANDGVEKRPQPGFLKLRITHRVFLEFVDTLTVKMNERRTVGDTEFSCEVVEFYPHFAIDSTKTVGSLSDEPENPAFKIRVYEKDKQTEDTWAFYGIDIPHYGRTSYLAFKVLEFEYRGTVIGREGGTGDPKGEEKRK